MPRGCVLLPCGGLPVRQSRLSIACDCRCCSNVLSQRRHAGAAWHVQVQPLSLHLPANCCCPAAAALVDLLTKYEHTPVLVAGTLRYTIVQWDDGRLVR